MPGISSERPHSQPSFNHHQGGGGGLGGSLGQVGSSATSGGSGGFHLDTLLQLDPGLQVRPTSSVYQYQMLRSLQRTTSIVYTHPPLVSQLYGSVKVL